MKRPFLSIAAVFLLMLFLQLFLYCLPLVLAENPIESTLKKAIYYKKLEDKQAQCLLCPRRCIIPDKRRGFCRVRENHDGTLYSMVYGKPCSAHIDPIEKKPLFHVIPGTETFSIATAGCNLACKFCQNWQISQAYPEEIPYQDLSPDAVVKLALSKGCPSIAYTYTEPTVFYEYMLDTAKLAHKAGLLNVMHSSGFINEEPLRQLCKYLDAANIDLKGSDKFYNELCLGNRADVLRTLKVLKEEGVWLEITYLLVPTLNDNDDYIKSTSVWIRENLGADTPLHISRFWPLYKLQNLPPTPIETLEKAGKIAREAGLLYVYIGNVPGHKGETTNCPKCKKCVIERLGYNVVEYNLDSAGRCKFCKEKISGVWKK